MTFYISDLHLGSVVTGEHTDLRGFSDLIEMNNYIIKQWNSRISINDEVIILGDFCVSSLADEVMSFLSMLKGKKALIVGNWDRYIENPAFDTSLFEWISPYKEIDDKGRKVVLSHYPILCYNGQYNLDNTGTPTTYMLYGHVHDTADETLVHDLVNQCQKQIRKFRGLEGPRNLPCQLINCYSKFSDYIPLTLDEWIELNHRRNTVIE